MRKLMKLQWHDLRNRLLLLDDDAEPEAIFRTLVGAFRTYLPQFCSRPFAHMGFARYFSMQAWPAPGAGWLCRIDSKGIRRAPETD